jgi:hypothetical protein
MMSTRMEPGEKLDDATIEAANARLAAKLGIGPSTAKAAEEGGVGPHNIMGVLQEMSRPQTGIPPAIDPALRIGLPSAADLDAVAAEQKAAQETAQQEAPKPKQTRTTVGKLRERYQNRIDLLNVEIDDAKVGIATRQVTIQKCEQKRAFWLEAIAEIERD